MTGVSVVSIPWDLLGIVRAGAYRDFECALEEARSRAATLDRENPAAGEQFVGLMGGVDDARALLDRIGWTSGRDEGPVEIDLRQYHPALQAALRDRLAREEDRLKTTAEGDPADAEATGRVEVLRRLLDEIGPFAPGDAGGREGEREVLYVLLSEMHEVSGRRQARWWRVEEVEAALGEGDLKAVRCALDGLVAKEVAVRNGELVRASTGVQHVNGLGITDL